MNNMVKVMLKKGIITDLARVTHSMDLSSPNVSASINAVLKPLETLTRSVNQPHSVHCARNQKKATNGNAGEASVSEAANPNNEANATANNAGTNTTNSEATRAQGDENLVEPDPEATEHDISTAAESIDPNSESQLHVSVALLKCTMLQKLSKCEVKAKNEFLPLRFYIKSILAKF